MSHAKQRAFCESVRQRLPHYFDGVFVMDIGSLDINGNNRYLFGNCCYLGVDLMPGRNVDIASKGGDLKLPDATFDVIISTECFEHDPYYKQTLINAARMLKPGGLFMFSCATTGRPEHGTRRTTPGDAPFTHSFGDWGDYYKNLEEQDIREALDVEALFRELEFSVQSETHDLYFWGIKRGKWNRRTDYSFLLPVGDCQRQLAFASEALSEIAAQRTRAEIAEQRAAHAEAEDSDTRIAQLAFASEALSEIAAQRTRAEIAEQRAAHAEAEQNDARAALQASQARMDELCASNSWRITAPLRALSDSLRGRRSSFMSSTHRDRLVRLAVRAKNALRYCARGDFKGLQQRITTLRRDGVLQRVSHSESSIRWGVMATPHTLFIAHLVASQLGKRGWHVEVMTEAPAHFSHDMYIVICPQMFSQLPPGERRIAFQMEQSISSRWFTSGYLQILERSLAILEYSLKNIEFLSCNGIKYPHVHYLPIGPSASHMLDVTVQSLDKKWDVLFYGDAKSSPRRQRMLETLQKHFNVRICSEVFGKNMASEIRRARVIINIHYYEKALLEMPRIQECLSLGVPIVSESSSDQDDYPEIRSAVRFFKEGDEQDMLRAVRQALDSGDNAVGVKQAVEMGVARFAFMFDRFLVAMNFLPATKLLEDNLPLPAETTRVVLSLPETIDRRRIYEAAAPEKFAVFDGVRLRPGWVGCGLSYAGLARHALRCGMRRLTVIEDDVLLPEAFEEKFRVINEYLETKSDQWDIFAGLIAHLHSDARVIGVEDYKGIRFVTIDKMTSTVCNIYNERALRLLAAWDSNDRNDQTNTIDRFIERQADLRVVIALPFFVGHREEAHSTLWGFQNTQYRELINASERALEKLVAAASTRRVA